VTQPARDATAQIARLRGVVWEWREDAPAEAREQPGMGVIAQEVEAVYPELIEPNEEGIRQVDYDGLVAPMLVATVELDRRLMALEAESERPVSESESGAKSDASEESATELAAKTASAALGTSLDPDAVEKLFPQLVRTNEEGEREVFYEGLVGLLIEAVKELDSRVAALEG